MDKKKEKRPGDSEPALEVDDQEYEDLEGVRVIS
jgi:hypothetical protein